MIEHHSREFIEVLHNDQLRLHGGVSGVRDEGMLESALAPLIQKEIYGRPDLYELASAYLLGMAENHTFVDGNKRTALAAADLFLYSTA